MLSICNYQLRCVKPLLAWLCVASTAAHALTDDGDRKPTSISRAVSTVAFETTDAQHLFETETLHPIPITSEMPDAAGIYVLPPIPLADDAQQTLDNKHVSSGSSSTTSGIEISINKNDDDDDEKTPLNFFQLLEDPYTAYRSKQSNLSWIPGSGQDFGLVEWNSEAYLERDESSGFTGAMNMTWLSGPRSAALPARVYEISAGFQTRQQWTPLFSYDLSASIGIFSDFEGSAREGVRFPSHAVGIFHINNSTDMVFGADFLDRDDISVLPVFGFSFRSPNFNRFRLDLIFPRPRIEFNFNESKRMYVSGAMGGGTWDVDDGIDLVATYRDYRVMLGFENADDDGETSAIELGYVFGRQMELRGQSGQTEFDDAFMIRWVTRH